MTASAGPVADYPPRSGFSSLYVAVQVWADNRPLTIPFYTPHKAFTSSYTSVLYASRSIATWTDEAGADGTCR